MKKIISLMLVLVLTLCMFAGCKPKIEDTEEYKNVEMTVEDLEREDYGRLAYEITDAQYIKDFYLQNAYTIIVETEDGKYHKTVAESIMSIPASYDMYIVITMTPVKYGNKKDIIFVYLSEKGTEKLNEEIEKFKWDVR